MKKSEQDNLCKSSPRIRQRVSSKVTSMEETSKATSNMEGSDDPPSQNNANSGEEEVGDLREKRLEQNRKTAKLRRDRYRQYLDDLQIKETELKFQNDCLKRENDDLNTRRLKLLTFLQSTGGGGGAQTMPAVAAAGAGLGSTIAAGSVNNFLNPHDLGRSLATINGQLSSLITSSQTNPLLPPNASNSSELIDDHQHRASLMSSLLASSSRGLRAAEESLAQHNGNQASSSQSLQQPPVNSQGSIAALIQLTQQRNQEQLAALQQQVESINHRTNQQHLSGEVRNSSFSGLPSNVGLPPIPPLPIMNAHNNRNNQDGGGGGNRFNTSVENRPPKVFQQSRNDMPVGEERQQSFSSSHSKSHDAELALNQQQGTLYQGQQGQRIRSSLISDELHQQELIERNRQQQLLQTLLLRRQSQFLNNQQGGLLGQTMNVGGAPRSGTTDEGNQESEEQGDCSRTIKKAKK